MVIVFGLSLCLSIFLSLVVIMGIYFNITGDNIRGKVWTIIFGVFSGISWALTILFFRLIS